VIPIPPRAAVMACIVLPAALSLSVDAGTGGSGAATRRHVIRDTSRRVRRSHPDAYIAGLGAPTISLENRNRAIHAYGTFFNGEDTFAVSRSRTCSWGAQPEIEWWYRRYPSK